MKKNQVTKGAKQNRTGNKEENLPLNSLDEKKIALLTQKIQHFSGPLPSPDTLREYNDILPDAAERIFKMAEKSQEHFEATEKKLVDFEIKKVSKGQNYAFTIALVGIISAVVCAFNNQVTVGSILGGATLISLVPHFIHGKQKKTDDDDQFNPDDAVTESDKKRLNSGAE